MHIECDYCGALHAPAAADNERRPVCPVCAEALLKLCPTPLFTPRYAALMVWPFVQFPWPDDEVQEHRV